MFQLERMLRLHSAFTMCIEEAETNGRFRTYTILVQKSRELFGKD